MIILLLLVPIIGTLLILNIKDNKKIKEIGLATAMINFIISIIMWNKFDYSCCQPQFLIRFTNTITAGVDGISLLFLLLTTFIIVISILGGWNIDKNIKYFINSLLILESILVGVFVILDILIFYIFFETSLIPMFLLIGLFGSNSQGYKKGKEKEELTRIYATYQFFLMTLAGSLLMLLAILILYSFSGTYDYIFISSSYLLPSRQFILWLSLSFSKKDMTYSLIHSSNNTLNNKKINTNLNTIPKDLECKSLVVYGSNLGSTLKYKGFSSKLRSIYQIPKHLNSIILGVLLSDGYLYKNKNDKTLLAFKQKNFEYLWFVYNKLSHYCRSLPKITTTGIDRNRYQIFMFATRVYPCFTKWHDLLYVNGIKRVPLDLYYMLTYETLAHWIMGDGTKTYKGITLQTQSFTVQECTFIISVLNYKFNLKCNIHMQRNQPTIYISSKSVKKLKPNILSYFCSTMKYKLGE